MAEAEALNSTDGGAGEGTIESNTAAMLSTFQEPAGGDSEIPAAAEGQIEDQTAQMLAAFTEANQQVLAEQADAQEAASPGADASNTSKQEVALPGGKGASDTKPDDRLIKVKGLDKQQLCIDLLMVGCVQSFVDFFYITHRKSAPNEANPMELEQKDVDIPEDTLMFLKETLEIAESARRAANYQHCFESYNTLAEYFEKVPDLKSAMYFYQRCADVASEVDARESISKAFLNLGTCEEQGDNWQSAMQFHEKALHIATSADSLPLQIKAASRLTQVYQVLAENCEKEGRDTEATALYERCRTVLS